MRRYTVASVPRVLYSVHRPKDDRFCVWDRESCAMEGVVVVAPINFSASSVRIDHVSPRGWSELLCVFGGDLLCTIN